MRGQKGLKGRRDALKIEINFKFKIKVIVKNFTLKIKNSGPVPSLLKMMDMGIQYSHVDFYYKNTLALEIPFKTL